jgi:hypothetical protein
MDTRKSKYKNTQWGVFASWLLGRQRTRIHVQDNTVVLWLRFFWTWLRFFRSFFLSCKLNARVKLVKTGHDPHSSTLVCICVVRLLFVLFCVLFVCKSVLPPRDNPVAVNKYHISYHIMSHVIYHITSHHISSHLISSYHISYITSYHVTYPISYLIFHLIYHMSYHISYHRGKAMATYP